MPRRGHADCKGLWPFTSRHHRAHLIARTASLTGCRGELWECCNCRCPISQRVCSGAPCGCGGAGSPVSHVGGGQPVVRGVCGRRAGPRPRRRRPQAAALPDVQKGHAALSSPPPTSSPTVRAVLRSARCLTGHRSLDEAWGLSNHKQAMCGNLAFTCMTCSLHISLHSLSSKLLSYRTCVKRSVTQC